MPLVSLWSRQIKTRTYWKFIIIIIIIIIINVVIIIIITIILCCCCCCFFFSGPRKGLSMGQVKWTEFFCPAQCV